MPSAAALLAMMSFLSNARLWRSAGRRVTGKTAGHLVATDWLRIDLAGQGRQSVTPDMNHGYLARLLAGRTLIS
jgi:hypothetical protein